MNKFLPVVTIDGPSGVGKSTVSDLLAKKLDIPHLDTGAMFRYSALVLEENGPTMPDAEVQTKLSKLEFDLVGNGAEAKLYCNGKAIGDEIRTEQVALLASKIAQRPVVRQFMLQSESKIGAKHAIIADGRDTGTVVFPDAAFKIFLTATPLTRAIRRKHDLVKLGIDADLATLEKDMAERDKQDRDRKIAPLRPADDAKIIDNSNLTIEQVLNEILAYIRQRGIATGTTLLP
ncbi:MAG: (d)CMP kinase [Desulfovibrio sp.]|nr:(d)CMP kinase [Desulfovibrio sp.]